MTGPVIFADEDARRQLTEMGTVVTFRTSERTTGDTWWRKSRTGPKEGDCTISCIGPVDASVYNELEPYFLDAGFDSVAEWQEAIKNLNDGLPEGYLYRVDLPRGENQ